MFLTERLADRVVVSGEAYLVNPAFDVILDIQALYKEEVLTDRDKMEQALQMLVVSRRKLRRLSAPKKVELLNAIYDQWREYAEEAAAEAEASNLGLRA